MRRRTFFRTRCREPFQLVGSPAAHDYRLRSGRSDEHGHVARDLRGDSPRNGDTVRFPGLAPIVQRPGGHDRRPASGAPSRVGGNGARAANQAFNVVNGDYFRWRNMWPRIADYFHVPVAPYPGHEEPLAERLKDIGGEWDKIVKKYGLRDYPIEKVAPWWHVDIDLAAPSSASPTWERAGSSASSTTRTPGVPSLLSFERLRAERIIP